ncbi:MAG: HNH endonuclease [Brumimicrobium sp.]|nr:HNH endonuclease [Brumimicrobium sp.]
MEKKKRTAIPQTTKVRANLQKEIGSVCPFCNNDDVGHFEIHHIDENPSNNEIGNLLLLCPICHSKITKGDISNIDVYKKKILLVTNLTTTKSNSKTVNFNSKVGNAVVGDNNTISINQPKKTVKQKYPEGCIGFDTVKANYIGHLIKRYNEYKEYEVGKGQVKYAVFAGHLKKHFKIAPTRTLYNLHIDKFEELSTYIQSRIDGTKLAKVKGREHKNYSTFEDFAKEQQ